MLSSMASLRAQLLPRISIGNCCSNFHALLNDFLFEGCGAASDNTFLCLQEYKDPELRVCCGWHKKCIEEKQEAIKKKQSAEAEANRQDMETVVNATEQSAAQCPFNNSQRWLQGPRFGNLQNDPLMSEELAKSMILDVYNAPLAHDQSGLQSLMQRTICHPKSRLVNSTYQSHDTLEDDRLVRLWSVKLIYLAVHYHQHRLAIPEALARYDNTTTSTCLSKEQLARDHGVGELDYECPNAKYLIMGLGGNGLGANVRGGMVPALAIGLMTDRVVVFVNNANVGPKHVQEPWALASCPRRDYQCFFLPLTPCTLTQEDIANAYTLSVDESNGLTRKNVLPDSSLNKHKVWRFQSSSMPISTFLKVAADSLHKYATDFIAALPASTQTENIAVLQKAAEAIRIEDDHRQGYHYTAASNKIQHALTLYSMRPNPSNAAKLDNIMNDITPYDFDPEMAVGLPVRGTLARSSISNHSDLRSDPTWLTIFRSFFSLMVIVASDKCKGESECLSFDQHMQVTSQMWQIHQNLTDAKVHPTVVFTTEATSMVAEQKAFVAENRTHLYPFHFNFVTNTHDVTPDSGFMKDIGKSSSCVVNSFQMVD